MSAAKIFCRSYILALSFLVGSSGLATEQEPQHFVYDESTFDRFETALRSKVRSANLRMETLPDPIQLEEIIQRTCGKNRNKKCRNETIAEIHLAIDQMKTGVENDSVLEKMISGISKHLKNLVGRTSKVLNFGTSPEFERAKLFHKAKHPSFPYSSISVFLVQDISSSLDSQVANGKVNGYVFPYEDADHYNTTLLSFQANQGSHITIVELKTYVIGIGKLIQEALREVFGTAEIIILRKPDHDNFSGPQFEGTLVHEVLHVIDRRKVPRLNSRGVRFLQQVQIWKSLNKVNIQRVTHPIAWLDSVTFSNSFADSTESAEEMARANLMAEYIRFGIYALEKREQRAYQTEFRFYELFHGYTEKNIAERFSLGDEDVGIRLKIQDGKPSVKANPWILFPHFLKDLWKTRTQF